MGDRGNIHLTNENIYFYTHWNGTELRRILASALKRGQERWDDPSYLNRIIFCELTKEDPEGLTGFGINSHEMDNEHQLIHVDNENKVIIIGEKSYSFAQFIKTKQPDLD